MFDDIEELEQKLSSEDVNERQEACYLLGKLEIPEVAISLRRALNDSDPTVQNIARKSLTRLEQLGMIPTGSIPEEGAQPKPPETSPSGRFGGTPPSVDGRPESKPAVSPKFIASTPSQGEPPASVSGTPPQKTEETPKPAPNFNLPPVIPPPPPVSAMKTEEPATPLPPLESPPSKPHPVTPAVAKAPARPAKASVSQLAVDLLYEPGPEEIKREPLIVPRVKAPVPEPAVAAPPPEAPAEKSGPLEGDNAQWKIIIAEKGDTFAAWIGKKDRKSKIDILTEMEKSSANILWSKKLQPLLTAETDAFVISKLLKAFGYHHGPRILKYVEVYLEHSDTRVVSNCLESLSLAGDPEDLERITTFLDHSDSRIKSTAAQALWKSNPKKAMEVVKRLAMSQRVWERDAAKFALVSCPLEERKLLQEALSRKGAKKPADEAGGKESDKEKGKRNGKDTDESMPEWAKDLGPVGKVLAFPVNIGMEEPIPLWMLLLAVIVGLLFYFVVAGPFFDWLFPTPSVAR